jgi:tRNA (guanine-N7-)-methyltransferase
MGRIRQHVNPLRSDLLAIAVARLDVPIGAAVEVELGSAEAHFLMDRAVHEPAGFYVGVEIRREMVTKANQESAMRGLAGRVVSVHANMTTDLARLFSPGQVQRFFINFPDPWFKARQHKRRAVDQDLILGLLPLLAPEGAIFVNTDIFDIAMDAMAALEAQPTLRNLGGDWRFMRQSLFAARSRRERQCEALGTRVWRLGFARR